MRTATRLVLIVAVGAAVNVAVTWWLAYDPQFVETRSSNATVGAWRYERDEHGSAGGTRVQIKRSRLSEIDQQFNRSNQSASRVATPEPWNCDCESMTRAFAIDRDCPLEMTCASFGWPVRCLNYCWDSREKTPQGAIALHSDWGNVRGGLPLTPIWRGLVVNSIAYAGVVGVLVLSARRFIRVIVRPKPLPETQQLVLISRRAHIGRWALASLFLGVMTNYAVAWALAVRPPQSSEARQSRFIYTDGRADVHISTRPGEASAIVGPAITNWPSPIVWVSTDQGRSLLPEFSEIRGAHQPSDLIDGDHGDDQIIAYKERATGWPFLSVRSSATCHWLSQYEYDRPEAAQQYLRKSGLVVLPESLRPDGFRAELPLIPIWSGFAMNSLIYAMPMALVIAAVRFRGRRVTCPVHPGEAGAAEVLHS
jgi:hypothetical protein